MAYCITVVQHDGKIFSQIFDQDIVTVGRSSANDVCTDPILYSQVSRHHSRIIRRGPQEFIFEDLESTQGSFYEGRKIRGRILINRDDVISLGKDGPSVSVTWARARITGERGTHYRLYDRPSPAFPLVFSGDFMSNYKRYEKIGSGGFGEVWRGYKENAERDVAIKLLHPMLMSPDHLDEHDRASLIRRFSREANLTHQLALSGVEGVVPVHLWGDDADKDYLFLVMDFIEGIPLDKLIRSNERMTCEEVVHYFRQVAAALDAAHNFEFTDDQGKHCRGIIHRDVKPGNLLIEKEKGKAWVVDFGVAGISEGGDRLTSSHIAVGTHLYMPPEAVFSKDVTAASDLWAFAVTLYLTLSGGQYPFQPMEAGLLHDRLTEADYTPIEYHYSSIPAELGRALRNSLNPHPEVRIQTAREWVELLSQLSPQRDR